LLWIQKPISSNKKAGRFAKAQKGTLSQNGYGTHTGTMATACVYDKQRIISLRFETCCVTLFLRFGKCKYLITRLFEHDLQPRETYIYNVHLQKKLLFDGKIYTTIYRLTQKIYTLTWLKKVYKQNLHSYISNANLQQKLTTKIYNRNLQEKSTRKTYNKYLHRKFTYLHLQLKLKTKTYNKNLKQKFTTTNLQKNSTTQTYTKNLHTYMAEI